MPTAQKLSIAGTSLYYDSKAVEGHRTPRRWRVSRRLPNNAKRPGVRQPPGALAGARENVMVEKD